MAERRIVEAREPFSVTINGTPLTVSMGDRYYADDPVVASMDPAAQHRLWGELKVKSTVPPPPPEPTVPAVASVETATAGPGERRRVTRGSRSETA